WRSVSRTAFPSPSIRRGWRKSASAWRSSALISTQHSEPAVPKARCSSTTIRRTPMREVTQSSQASSPTHCAPIDGFRRPAPALDSRGARDRIRYSVASPEASSPTGGMSELPPGTAPPGRASSGGGPLALETPDWSVIVIARNEEARIGACLGAVTHAMRGRSHEVIVVDCASTDATLRIVARYRVRTVRLSAASLLSPAAARHVGFLHARGRLVLFVDGDSILDPAWVAPAARSIEAPNIAGVAGIRVAVTPCGTDTRRVPFPQDVSGGWREFLGGSALYRASVLRDVGGFNPFLRSCEEAELGARIRGRGYQLLRLPIAMIEHPTDDGLRTLRGLVRRLRRGFGYGAGELVRYALANRTVTGAQLKPVVRPLAALSMVVVGAASAAAAAMHWHPGVLYAWGALTCALLGALWYRTRSLQKALYYPAEWLL